MINKDLLGHDHETIIALCTPRGHGALALLRLTGSNVFQIADAFAQFSSRISITNVPTHTIHHGYIVDTTGDEQVVIDEVMFFVMDGPKTFTGQPTVEITCHNNPFIIQDIIRLAIAHGARNAEHGEFTKRAFLSGKIDLVQAEAINDVIHAQTERALRTSMAQLQGSLSHFLANLEERLVLLLCSLEASFEFLDEEQRDIALDRTIKNQLTAIASDIKTALAQYTHQRHIKEGVRVALCGAVNAGKSTLFNKLLNQQRSIVTDVPGTTRDSVESTLYKDGTFISLIDTAGLRATDDAIEQQGIVRTLHEAAQADVILLVIDASRKHTEAEEHDYLSMLEHHGEKVIMVLNKIDNYSNHEDNQKNCFTSHIPAVKLSAYTGVGIDALERAVEEKVQTLFKTLQSPFLLNQRQHSVLAEIDKKIDFIVTEGQLSLHYELMAYHLKEVLEVLAQATGKQVTERILDTVFSTFCVGK